MSLPPTQYHLLDREEDDVDFADTRWIVGRGDGFEVQIAIGAFEGQAVCPQRRQMRTARDEMNILTGRRESRAEVTANAARRHDRNFHTLLLIRRACLRRANRHPARASSTAWSEMRDQAAILSRNAT